MKKWAAKYEAASRQVELTQAFNAKDYAKAFSVGRQILEQEPENFEILLKVVNAGSLNARAGNKSLNTETIALHGNRFNSWTQTR